MLPPFCFTNDLASATVGQGKIAHDGVEVLRSQECKGAFHIVGGGNGMTEVPEQASQDTARIAGGFDPPHLQGDKYRENNRGHNNPARVPKPKKTARWFVFREGKFYYAS